MVFLWVVANFPAAVLFINVFGKLGSEWEYFLCVFAQWLIVGVGLGMLMVLVRWPWGDNNEPNEPTKARGSTPNFDSTSQHS